jgi:hypothetical protein
MRRRPQPDHLRTERNRAVVFVVRDMMESDEDRHGAFSCALCSAVISRIFSRSRICACQRIARRYRAGCRKLLHDACFASFPAIRKSTHLLRRREPGAMHTSGRSARLLKGQKIEKKHLQFRGLHAARATYEGITLLKAA